MPTRSVNPWRIHFLQRHGEDDPGLSVPAIDFLHGLPIKVAAEIHAVLDAVAKAPPPCFSGGGKWEAMHGEMSGYFEVRVQGGGNNHRLFCVLQRHAEDTWRAKHHLPGRAFQAAQDGGQGSRL